MVDVTSLRATASRLVQANGRLVTLTRRDRADANDAEPWRGPPAPEDGDPILFVSIKAAVVDMSEEDMANDILRNAKKKMIIAASDLEAAAVEVNNADLADGRNFDTITDEGEVVEIVHVILRKPGDTAIAYYLYMEG